MRKHIDLKPRTSEASEKGAQTTMCTAALNTSDPNHDGETELIRQVLAGQKQISYTLIRPYQRAVFLVTRAILGNDVDAEKAAQDAFVQALATLATFRGERKFGTWLVQLAINEARNKLRKARRSLYDSVEAPEQARQDEGNWFPGDLADWREIPSEELQSEELRLALSRALASLPSLDSTVCVLRDVQRFSTAETAELLHISEGAVKARLLRARLRMRDALARGFRKPRLNMTNDDPKGDR